MATFSEELADLIVEVVGEHTDKVAAPLREKIARLEKAVQRLHREIKRAAGREEAR
jgi:hypothetical protein